ncbi:hypothetical protein RB595_009683 [Gaeumannomyces hyphopodioides]
MYFSKRTLAGLLLSLALSEVGAQQTGPRFNNSTRSASGPRVGGGRVEVTSSAGAATTSRAGAGAGAGAGVAVGAPRGGAGAGAGSGQQLPPVATGGTGADELLPLPGDDNLAANPPVDALEPLPTIAPSPTLPAGLASSTDLTTALSSTLVRLTRSATTAAPVLSASQPLAPIVPPISSAAQSLSQTGGIAAPDIVIPSASSALLSLPQLGADPTAPGLDATTSRPAPSIAAGIIIVSSIPGGFLSSSQTSEDPIATTAAGTGEVPLASATTSSDGLLPIPSATDALTTGPATNATTTDATTTGATATNATVTAEASTTAETAATDASGTDASGLLPVPSATDAAALPSLPAASDATGLIPIPVATDAPFPLTNATGVANLQPIGTGTAPQPTESAEAAPETSLLPLPAAGPFANSTRPINGTAPAAGRNSTNPLAPGAGRNSTSPLVPGAGSDGSADESTLRPLPGADSPSGSGDAESPSRSGSPAGPAGGNPTSGTNPSGGEDPLASLPNVTGGQGGGSQTGTLRGLPTGTGGPSPTGTLQGLPSGTTLATSFTRPTSSVPSSLTTVVTSGGQTMTLTVPNAAAITAGTIVSGVPQAPGGGDPNAASGLAASDALAGGVAAVVAVFLMV